LEWADAFRGFVLEATIKRFGNKEDACEALGLGNLVRDRNHNRMINRNRELVAEFMNYIEEKPTRNVPQSTKLARAGSSPPEREQNDTGR
jgi:hypothetical protein